MTEVASARSDGLGQFAEYRLPQPVPWDRIPASAGQLPAWEQKKLELGMADLSAATPDPRTAGGVGDSPASASGHSRKTSKSSDAPSKLQKTTTGPSVASLRTSASRTNGAAGQSSDSIHTNGYDVHSQTSKKKKKNPLLRFLQRKFSKKDGLREQKYGKSAGIASVTEMPQNHGGISGTRGDGKKTRSRGFAAKMRETSGKVSTKVSATWVKMTSRTPKEQLPKSWDEWRKAYARGQIDVMDMPEPPPRDPTATDPTPFENQFFAAPLPENQRERQLAYQRLDPFGERGVKASEIPVPAGEEPLPDTLEGHPAFRNIVTQARALFDSSISILTVFNENRQLFLAETGLGGMKEVPREVTFCSHAVLQRPPQPFILTDTHEDWRFAQSPLVVKYGSRAYYGVPLLAPDFSGRAEPIPIGTLCVIDDKPRKDFTAEQRSKMGDLALLAQKTIANWSRARLQARLDAMEKSFQIWKNETATITEIPESSAVRSSPNVNGVVRRPSQKSVRNGPPPTSDIPPVPKINNTAGGVSMYPRSDAESSTESFQTAPQPANKQKVYDISTRLVARSLELPLVYILRLDFAKTSNLNPTADTAASVKSLSLLSSYGMPSPEPAFDAVLHFKALRSEEGGLLYQNPNVEELASGERLPQTDGVEYASALLVPVSESDTTGYVLAGFTDDPDRVFERDDLLYMTTIASELVPYLEE